MSQGFEGFLRQYCQELTGAKTTSLKRLLEIAALDTPRASEPLLLLALIQGREDYLLRCAEGSGLLDGYSSFVKRLIASKRTLVDFLASLPGDDRFAKVYLAWQSKTGQLQRDRQTLRQVALAMNALLQDKGLSRYEASRRLGLDKGNFYAFLKGDSARLSRETAMAAFRQLSVM